MLETVKMFDMNKIHKFYRTGTWLSCSMMHVLMHHVNGALQSCMTNTYEQSCIPYWTDVWAGFKLIQNGLCSRTVTN